MVYKPFVSYFKRLQNLFFYQYTHMKGCNIPVDMILIVSIVVTLQSILNNHCYLNREGNYVTLPLIFKAEKLLRAWNVD